MSDDEMDRAHRADMQAEGDFRQIAGRLDTLAEVEKARMASRTREAVLNAADRLRREADRIVRVWD